MGKLASKYDLSRIIMLSPTDKKMRIPQSYPPRMLAVKSPVPSDIDIAQVQRQPLLIALQETSSYSCQVGIEEDQ